MMRRLVPAVWLLLAGAAEGSSMAAPTPTPLSLAARDAIGSLASAPAVDDWPADDWDWVDRAPVRESDGKKSVPLAMTASAILPGLGEQYIGRGDRAKLFFLAEGLIWVGFGYYRVEGGIRRDRAIEFAQIHGHASTQGDADYYEHIGQWLSLEEWHEIVRRDARLRFPEDPAAQARFFEENKRYDESRFWEWDDDAERTEYRVLRSRFERSYRNSRLVAGAALINRLISVIHVMTLTRRHNRSLDEQRARLDFRIDTRGTADGLVIGPVLTKRY
jgi:hypothetical protein